MTTSRGCEPMHAFEYEVCVDSFEGARKAVYSGLTIREHAAIQIAAALCSQPSIEVAVIPFLAVSMADDLLVELDRPR